MAQQSFIAYDSKTGESYGVEAKCTSVADIAGNSSNVTVEVILHHGEINIKKRTAGTISIDGNKISYSTPAINAASTDTPVASHTVTVQHDADGAKSVEISASFPYELYSTKYKVDVDVVTVRGTFVLDRIGRVSVIADQTREIVADGADDNLWFLKMTRSSDTFWHKATLTMGAGNDPWIYTTDPFETEVTGATSTDWLYKMTTEKVGTMNVSVRTYLDESCSQAIGDPAETTFAVKLPESAYPSYFPANSSVSIYNTDTAADGMTVAVQGYSKLQIQFNSGYAEPQFGANITGFRVECEGKSYSCNINNNGASLIATDVLNRSGDINLHLHAVDSRGAESDDVRTVRVYAYFTPRIINVSVFRCDSTGTATVNGQSISVKAGAEYAKCGDKNSVTLSATIRAAGTDSGTTYSSLALDDANILGNDLLDTRKSYIVDLTVTDKLGNTSTTYSTTVSTDDISFHIRDGGKGAAFGKYAEDDGYVDFAWKMRARAGIFDEDLNEIVAPKLVPGVPTTTPGANTYEISGFSISATTERTLQTFSGAGLYLATINAKWATSSNSGALSAGIKVNGIEFATSYAESSSVANPSHNLCAFVSLGGDGVATFVANNGTGAALVLQKYRYQFVKIGG